MSAQHALFGEAARDLLLERLKFLLARFGLIEAGVSTLAQAVRCQPEWTALWVSVDGLFQTCVTLSLTLPLWRAA
jgi:hypothetical protein